MPDNDPRSEMRRLVRRQMLADAEQERKQRQAAEAERRRREEEERIQREKDEPALQELNKYVSIFLHAMRRAGNPRLEEFTNVDVVLSSDHPRADVPQWSYGSLSGWEVLTPSYSMPPAFDWNPKHMPGVLLTPKGEVLKMGRSGELRLVSQALASPHQLATHVDSIKERLVAIMAEAKVSP